MKKIIISTIISLLVLPSFVFAVEKTTYTPLEKDVTTFLGKTTPLGFSTQGQIDNSDWQSYILSLMVTIIIAITVIQSFRIAWVLESPDTLGPSQERITLGKKMFRQLVVGVIFVLMMWPLSNMLNSDILNGKISFSPPPKDNKSLSTATFATSTTSLPPISSGQVRSTLLAAGVKINHDECTYDQMAGTNNTPPPCTNVEGLPEETVNMLVYLKTIGCPSCVVEVTGGTEPGHETHGVGKYPVDLHCSDGGTPCANDNNPLNVFIRGLNKLNKTTSSPVSIANKTITYCNNIYGTYYNGSFYFCDENVSKTGSGAPHWHVFNNKGL